MGLLDYNRPRIVVGDDITYDMNTAGNIFSFANKNGYNILMIDVSATIDANNTSDGLIRAEAVTAVSGGGTTNPDIFDAEGRVYSPYLNDITLNDIQMNTRGNRHKRFYIDITGLSNVNLRVMTVANASLKVKYSASDGDMSSVVNKRPEQILLYKQLTGDGTTKTFGGSTLTKIGVSPLFKFLKVTVKSSQNISGRLAFQKQFYYQGSSYISLSIDAKTFTEQKYIETELIDCAGEMVSTLYLYLLDAPASETTIDVIITGVR